MKFSIEAETQKIENEIKALDSEKSKMEELIKQREEEPVNFGNAWRDAPVPNQKIEMQKVFYPDGTSSLTSALAVIKTLAERDSNRRFSPYKV